MGYIVTMLRLRPIQPASRWLTTNGFNSAPLFAGGIPRLVPASRAGSLLTFSELRALESDAELWRLFSFPFRYYDFGFDVFSEVMHLWVGTDALDRLRTVLVEKFSKFWTMKLFLDTVDSAARRAAVELTDAERIHSAMLLTLAEGDRDVASMLLTLEGIEGMGDMELTDGNADGIVPLVKRFGVARVAPYITPGCSLTMIGYGIEHGIDTELLTAAESW